MKLSNEAKIGFMVSVTVVLLLVLTFRAGEFSFRKEGYTVKVKFKNIDGINLNAPVMLNGFEVGSVRKITIDESGESADMVLNVWLDKKAKIHNGAQAYVKNMGFLGEKYVGLTSGNLQEELLQEGAVITGKEPADLDKLLREGEGIVTDIKQVTRNINERLTKNEQAIDSIFTNLDITMVNMAGITSNLNDRLKANERYIDDMIVHLHSSSVNLDQFTYDLKMNPWKLMYKTKETRQRNLEKHQKQMQMQ